MQVADMDENTIAQKLQGNFQSTGLLQGRCFLGLQLPTVVWLTVNFSAQYGMKQLFSYGEQG